MRTRHIFNADLCLTSFEIKNIKQHQLSKGLYFTHNLLNIPKDVTDVALLDKYAKT